MAKYRVVLNYDKGTQLIWADDCRELNGYLELRQFGTGNSMQVGGGATTVAIFKPDQWLSVRKVESRD